MISQCHPIPQNVPLATSGLVLLAVATLANNVLYSVDLLAAMHSVDHDVLLVLGWPHQHDLC